MGHIISSESFRADPNNVREIDEILGPSDNRVQNMLERQIDVRKLFQVYHTWLSHQHLVKKDSEFVWEEDVHGKCLGRLIKR